MIPNCESSLCSGISSALQVLEHIQGTVDSLNDDKLKANTRDDLVLLISTLQNPILRSIATIQGSLTDLDKQLQEHPSILPADFNINEAGELELNVQRSVYDPDYQTLTREFDDQRVPVVKLSFGEPSPHVNNLEIDDLTLPPITTPSYALEFQRVIEETSNGREVLTVQLYKPDGNSLGFSVVGLRTEEKGEIGIFIQEIQTNGIAGRDGRLREGDQILAIDGQPLDTNVSHPQAIAILQQARGVVELVIARPSDVNESHSPSPSAVSDTSKIGADMVLTSDWAQVEVIDLINDGSGLGFGIVGGKSTGVVVKTILPGGVADRNNRLQSGDHILQIGEVNLRGMGSEQVAAVLRQSGSHVRIVVARPVDSSNPDYLQSLESSAPIVPSSVLANPDELNRYFMSHGYPEFNVIPRTAGILDEYSLCNGSSTNLNENMILKALPTSMPVLTMDMIPVESLTNLPEMEKFDVELKKDSHGLGITIAGYVCEKEELSGIFIKSISEGSAADMCKKIQVNDRIVEVDKKALQGLTNHESVEVLRSTGQIVNLSLERYLRGPKFEQLQLAIANSEVKPRSQTSPSIASLPRFPIITDEESTMIDIDLEESKTTIDLAVILDASNDEIDLGNLIDNDYDGLLKPNVEAALRAKWSNILEPGCEIIVSQLSKFSDTGGLGISLEGTVDVVNGKEIRPHHYIRSILPEGPIGRHTCLRPGDELLEVNGRRLLDMNHSEVVKTLKELPRSFRLVCCRNLKHAPIQVIDTAQEKSAFAARNILGGSLNNLIPATDRLVKAKSDGSLVSTGTINTDSNLSKLKSRSLEPLTGLAMWSSEPQIIELVKGERGLGFSILDYQDPINPSETVIVIRSLVPGGVAQLDGRLIPGDRLLSVNDTILENASLDQAVQVLKGAPKGVVRIGVAKPLPIADSLSTNKLFKLKQNNVLTKPKTDTSSCAIDTGSTIDENHSMYSCTESLPRSPDPNDMEQLTFEYESAAPGNQTPENSSLTEDTTIDASIKSLPLPIALEQEIRIHKGYKSLGVSVECVGDGTNGVVITETTTGGAFKCDGRITVGDFLLSINNACLRRCTQSQARSILKRTQLLSTDIVVIFISGRNALQYWKSLKRCEIMPLPPPHISSQISPRSPYIDLPQPTGFTDKSGLRVVEESLYTTKKKSLSVDGQNFNLSKQSLKIKNFVLDNRTQSGSYSFDLPVSNHSADNLLISNNEVDEEPCGVNCQQNLMLSEESCKSDDSIFNISKPILLSEISLNASKCSSIRDIYSSRESDSTDFIKSRENISQFEYSSKSESDNSNYRISFPEDELLKEEIRELGRLSKLHRLGSVDFDSYQGAYKNDLAAGEKLKTIHRFASTGVELGNDNVDMILDRSLETASLLWKHWGPERHVQVYRDENNSLGISIVGGKVDLYNSDEESRCAISGIFIRNVIAQSSADKNGEFKAGDRILEVNGIDLRSATHETAVHTIQTAGNPVTFVVQSLIQWSTTINELGDNSLETPSTCDMSASSISNNHQASAPVDQENDTVEELVSNLETSEEVTENHVRTKAGKLIMRNSAGSLKKSDLVAAAGSINNSVDDDDEEEDDFGYTINKVKKKYGHVGKNVLIVEVERGPQGLGLSLAGHKDRTKMAVFVCGINPKGSAYKSGNIQVGDEILEVNGYVVHGRCHLNASAIIKGLPGPIFKLIIFRRDIEGVPVELAVKPLTQFPVTLEEEPPEEKYANFKGVRVISVKKATPPAEGQNVNTVLLQGHHGIGIMIIEGKHPEVGHGIFISDIQEGSVADQAGLMVGDMILSVNKDSLIGYNYDSAAQLLKQTEGILTLVVCNPKRDTHQEALSTNDSDKKMSESTSSAVVPEVPTIVEEPPADPATAPIIPGQECTIEINREKTALGFSIVGGCDTLLNGIVIREVYPGGAADKDGRLKHGDQILEVNSENFCNITHDKASLSLKRPCAKVTMVVYRGEYEKEEDMLDLIDVELNKKPGKGLGLSVGGKKDGTGVFIAEVLPGGAASADGRLMNGDLILSVMDQDLRNATQEEAAIALKLASGKVTLKLGRLKVKAGSAASDNRVNNEVIDLVDGNGINDRISPLVNRHLLRRRFSLKSLRRKYREKAP